MPDFLSDVKWEMASWELEETHRLAIAHQRDFREVYIENNPTDPRVENIIYYFAVIEGRGDRPLYEVIVNFKSEAERDNYASSAYGHPNLENGEWKWEIDGSTYKAWKFQNKLIVVKVVPGCEWDE